MQLTTELIGIIGAMLVQAATLVWWAATINGRVSSQDERLASLEHEQRSHEKALQNMSTVMARLDERTAAMASSMDRLVKRLDEHQK